MPFLTDFARAAAVAGFAVAGAALQPANAQETTQPAPAQTQPAPSETPPSTSPSAPAASFSDDKLRSFAVAFLEVDKLNKEYGPRVEAAPSEDEKNKLREEAGQKMVEVVNGTQGISTEEYGSIMNAAQNDPQLVSRIQTLIGEEAQKQQ